MMKMTIVSAFTIACLCLNWMAVHSLNTDHALHFQIKIIANIQDNMQVMQRRIQQFQTNERELKETVTSLKDTIEQLQHSDAQLRVKTQDLSNRLKIAESTIETFNKGVNPNKVREEIPVYVKQSICLPNTSKSKRETVRRQHSSGAPIAFTAYLDSVPQLGVEQAVQYNKLLLNEGNGYSNNTGIFRAPVHGIYVFHWTITAKKMTGTGAYDVWVKLVVNGRHQVGAVAESSNDYFDSQGGNMAVVRLTAGDEVWISHYNGYTNIHGEDIERTTSFSGFLLLELEMPNIIG